MKKTLLLLLALTSISIYADTHLTCSSKNFSIVLVYNSKGEIINSNYGIKGYLNDEADVFVENSYVSPRVISAQLNVDGVSNKFEISVTKKANGIFEGNIISGDITEFASCREFDVSYSN